MGEKERGGGGIQFKTSGRGSHKETQTGPRTVGGPVEGSRKEDKNQEKNIYRRDKKIKIYSQKFMFIHGLKARP